MEQLRASWRANRCVNAVGYGYVLACLLFHDGPRPYYQMPLEVLVSFLLIYNGHYAMTRDTGCFHHFIVSRDSFIALHLHAQSNG